MRAIDAASVASFVAHAPPSPAAPRSLLGKKAKMPTCTHAPGECLLEPRDLIAQDRTTGSKHPRRRFFELDTKSLVLAIGTGKIDLHGPSASSARRPFSLPG